MENFEMENFEVLETALDAVTEEAVPAVTEATLAVVDTPVADVVEAAADAAPSMLDSVLKVSGGLAIAGAVGYGVYKAGTWLWGKIRPKKDDAKATDHDFVVVDDTDVAAAKEKAKASSVENKTKK